MTDPKKLNFNMQDLEGLVDEVNQVEDGEVSGI